MARPDCREDGDGAEIPAAPEARQRIAIVETFARAAASMSYGVSPTMIVSAGEDPRRSSATRNEIGPGFDPRRRGIRAARRRRRRRSPRPSDRRRPRREAGRRRRPRSPRRSRRTRARGSGSMSTSTRAVKRPEVREVLFHHEATLEAMVERRVVLDVDEFGEQLVAVHPDSIARARTGPVAMTAQRFDPRVRIRRRCSRGACRRCRRVRLEYAPWSFPSMQPMCRSGRGFNVGEHQFAV